MAETETTHNVSVAEEFAQHVIDSLRKGTAPWMKPWKAGEFVQPRNPLSGTVYKGANLIRLAEANRSDPRWMTLRQANQAGMTVKEGSRGARVMFWKFDRREAVLNGEGRPTFDADGKAVMRTTPLERPMLGVSHVFHASQINGMEEWKEPEEPQRDAGERVGAILRNSGANITALDHGTALRELARWADRQHYGFGETPGSEAYARETLRVGIASWMLCAELGLSHTPDISHQGYVEQWVTSIGDDPYAIVRACQDAEKTKDLILGMEKERYMGKEKPQRETPAAPATEKRWLDVPYAEKDQARDAGARWDRRERRWFAPEGTDMTALSAWLPGRNVEHGTPALSPEAEFAERLREAGLDLRGYMPIMDGTLHRVPLLDHPNRRDGSYKGHRDGRPAGWFQNFVTGETGTWKHSGHKLDAAQLNQLKSKAARDWEQFQAIQKEQHEQAAKRCFAIWKDERNAWATPEHPYLKAKGVPAFGLKIDAQGNLLVAGRDTEGRIHTMQTIVRDEEKFLKRFERGAGVGGAFHVINPEKKSLDGGTFFIAEGYATAASVYLATGHPVVCAFNAGNLDLVAEALRAKHPDAEIVICADNDHSVMRGDQPYNVGVVMANKAAAAVDGLVVTPELTEEERGAGLTDFNDLHTARGLEVLRKQIEKSLVQAREHNAQGKDARRESGGKQPQGMQMAM